LDQFKRLSEEERREVLNALAQETSPPLPSERRRKRISELRTFVPTECPELKDHDRWFAEAILASKRGDEPE